MLLKIELYSIVFYIIIFKMLTGKEEKVPKNNKVDKRM